MVRKKLCKILATLMVATTILGMNGQVVGATTGNNQLTVISNQIVANGIYEVDNVALRTGSQNESSMKNYIERKSTIKVEENKITVTIKFNEAGLVAVQEVHGATVNGEEIETIKNEDSSISFIVPTIDSKINIDLTYKAETSFGTWEHRTTFDLVNDVSKIPTIDDSVDGEDDVVTPEIPETPDNNDGNIGSEESNVLADGNYTLNNAIYKLGTNQESMARGFIEDKTFITVKDGIITMTLKYKGLGLTGIRGTSIKVNGVDTSSIVNADKSVSFEVPSIDSKIEVEMDIYVVAAGFSEIQSVDFVNDVDSLTKVEDNNLGGDNNGESPETPEIPETPESGGNTEDGGNADSDSSNNGSTNDGNTENQETKVYIGKNEVTHENETGLSMSRQALEEILKVEEINGKKYVTLTFTTMGSTMMKDHIIYVNENKVEAVKSVNGNIVSLRFLVGTLEDSIKVSAYVDMMGKNVEFGVNILKDTLTLVNDETTGNGTTGGTTNNGTINNNGTTNNVTITGGSNNTNATGESQVTVGKLYSIKNNVIHESETGVAMARKYLSATSKVEEIKGTYYITLTFTGSSFMKNHEVYVNGSKVKMSKSTNGDETYVRFAVGSLSDNITVKAYIVPMSREVEFGVQLLEDTLTFIKEYKVETLPNTGAEVGAGAVAGLGLIMTSAGTALFKKRK